MLVASRPGCRLPQFHQFISIKGFSKETISTCITSEFSCDPGKMEYFSEQLKSNVLVGSMCHVPFNLALILNLCQSDVPLPVTWTELYTTFVWGLARLSVKNSGKYEHDIDHLSCYDDLPRELQQSLGGHFVSWLSRVLNNATLLYLYQRLPISSLQN